MTLHGFNPFIAVILLIVLCMATFVLVMPRASAVMGTQMLALQASPENIGYGGLDPTAISLNWTQDTNSTFIEYVVQESTVSANGPWVTIQNIPISTTTSFYYAGLSPGAAEWWQVVYYETLGHPSDNVLGVTQPSVASLSLSQPTATSVQLKWNNYATYGGLLSFSSYQLMESVNQGPYRLAASVIDVNVFSYTLDGLVPATNYSFYLNTTDGCACSPSSPSSSVSNSVSLTTPGLLSASALVDHTMIDAGQSVSFTCQGAGGVPPYTYSWAFGDGVTEGGGDLSHVYTSTGMMTAGCTVVDLLGTQATVPVLVSVFPDPQVSSLSARPASADVGQSAVLAIQVTGGLGSYTYSWSNLPGSCTNANSYQVSCTLTSSGNFLISVQVTDLSGFTANSSVLSYRVYSDPNIISFEATPTAVSIGQSVSLVVVASGGNSALHYSYSNLPPGCYSSDASSITCSPDSSGDFTVTVTVSDQAGKSATSTVQFSVSPSRVLGLPHDLGLEVSYTLTGIIVASVAIGVAVAFRRRKT